MNANTGSSEPVYANKTAGQVKVGGVTIFCSRCGKVIDSFENLQPETICYCLVIRIAQEKQIQS